MKNIKRVLLKLSGEALAGEKGNGFDESNVIRIGKQVKYLLDDDIQVAIVIGGGNFWRGRSNNNMDRTKADEIGMLATVMNCLYVAEMFRTIGIDAVVQTPIKIGTITEEFSKDLATKHLAEKKAVFFAGGTGHPFFSTDTASALRAIEIESDLILLAKNIDGVYDKDPKEHKDAIKFDEISLSEVIKRDLKVMDLSAAIMCLEFKIPMKVFYLNEEDSIINAIKKDDNNGTLVHI